MSLFRRGEGGIKFSLIGNLALVKFYLYCIGRSIFPKSALIGKEIFPFLS